MISVQKPNLRELAAFFILTFAIGWLAWLPLLANPQGPTASLFVFLFSPAIAACAVSGATSGRAGVRAIVGRYLLWRFHIQWYLLALLFVPFIFFLATLIFFGSSARSLWTGNSPYFVAASFVFLMVINSGEEIGWRGFALPRMQEVFHNPWLASIVLGVIWGAWHLPQYFVPGETNIPLLPFLVLIAGLSTVYTALFNNTQGSLLLAVLLHASTDIVPRILRTGSLPAAEWWLISGLILISGIALHWAANKSATSQDAFQSKHDTGRNTRAGYNPVGISDERNPRN